MANERVLQVTGVGKISIRRAETGLLVAAAESDVDLYRALGACHAQDRSLQMLILRTLGYGRGSELLASDDAMLAIDTFFRRADFPRDAAAEAAKLSPEELACCEAYCDGVNQIWARWVPWEWRLVARKKPEPWTLAHSVMLSRLVSYVALAQTQADLERLVVELIQAGIEKPALEELFPGCLEGLDLDLVRRVQLDARVVPAAVRFAAGLPKALASNNWVVSGARTKSESPMLASDPHLEVNSLPAVWYECVLRLPGRFLTGAGMPGLPAILIGRNDEVAWGVTYSFLDGVDSWIEDVRDGKYRRVEDGREVWKDFRVRRETIVRRGKPDAVVAFYENDHGVLDGDPGAPALRLATKWASLEGSGARSIRALMAQLHTHSASESLQHLGQLETSWNWVAADVHGHVGYQMSGRMPLRPNGGRGLVPLPGWDPAHDWQGFAEPEELPRAQDPDCGFFVTANEDLNAYGKRAPINAPMGGWRASRIRSLLATRHDWDVAGFRDLQMDLHSLEAELYLGLLRPMLGDSAAERELAAWDCRCAPDSRAATLFEAWRRELFLVVFGGGFGPDVARHLLEESALFADFYDAFDRVFLAEDSAWFRGRPRAELYREALKRALLLPPRVWGEAQEVTMSHMLFGGKLPRWAGFDHGPIALKGSRATIHQGQIYRSGGRQSSFAPSFRLVTDLAERATHTILAGGPSDRRFSAWYVSEVAAWLAGRLKRVGL